MELNSTLIGIIVLLLIFIPVGYLIISSSGKNKKLKKTLADISKAKGINLRDIDVIGNLVIGLDDVSKNLVYASKLNLADDFKIVNLEEVKDCRVKSIKQGETSLDWVGLEVVGKAGKLEIPFYTELDETGLSRDPFVCLQDAKRWENAVRPLLKAS